MVESVIGHFGRIDVLVNNAGSSPGGILEELSEEDWAQSLQLKFMGYVRCCKEIIPYMRKQGTGSIITQSSDAAYLRFPTGVVDELPKTSMQ